MVVETERVLAFRCSACGQRVERDISIFLLVREEVVHCACGAWAASLRRTGGALDALVSCLVCESAHAYHIGIRSLAKRSPKPLYCHDSHYAIGYIGEDEDVRVAISRQDSLENLVFDPDYADYFDHPLIMYETLASIQALAEVDRLRCSCGSEEIEVDVASDRVGLCCAVCGGTAELMASCDGDLALLRGLERITLKASGGIKRV